MAATSDNIINFWVKLGRPKAADLDEVSRLLGKHQVAAVFGTVAAVVSFQMTYTSALIESPAVRLIAGLIVFIAAFVLAGYAISAFFGLTILRKIERDYGPGSGKKVLAWFQSADEGQVLDLDWLLSRPSRMSRQPDEKG